jgi:hypothetical protein
MPSRVRVSHNYQTEVIGTIEGLRNSLATPDSRGGGEFWLDVVGRDFPCIAVRTTRGHADVHYFPSSGHPGFRLLSNCSQPTDVNFQFEGCDPYDGELVPGEFVVELSAAQAVAVQFMEAGEIHDLSNWFEV